MNFVKEGLLKLNELPQSWDDPKWRRVHEKYGLNNVEVTELKFEVELQKARDKRNNLYNMHCCIGCAKILLDRNGMSVEMLPKDLNDRQWHKIQQELKMADIFFTALLYHVAVREETRKKEQNEQQIREGVVMDKWVDSALHGAPNSFFHRRRTGALSCL